MDRVFEVSVSAGHYDAMRKDRVFTKTAAGVIYQSTPMDNEEREPRLPFSLWAICIRTHDPLRHPGLAGSRWSTQNGPAKAEQRIANFVPHLLLITGKVMAAQSPKFYLLESLD